MTPCLPIDVDGVVLPFYCVDVCCIALGAKRMSKCPGSRQREHLGDLTEDYYFG